MPINQLFNNPKFINKSFEQICETTRNNWSSACAGIKCICCGKERPDTEKYFITPYSCSEECASMFHLSRYGTCNHCIMIPSFAYDAECDCEKCGRRTWGTSD